MDVPVGFIAEEDRPLHKESLRQVQLYVIQKNCRIRYLHRYAQLYVQNKQKVLTLDHLW